MSRIFTFDEKVAVMLLQHSAIFGARPRHGPWSYTLRLLRTVAHLSTRGEVRDEAYGVVAGGGHRCRKNHSQRRLEGYTSRSVDSGRGWRPEKAFDTGPHLLLRDTHSTPPWI